MGIIKKIIYWILKMMLFLVLLAGAIASAVFVPITVLPESSASKANLLGYKSHCSFVPISTISLVIIALVPSFILKKIYGKKILQIIGAVAS